MPPCPSERDGNDANPNIGPASSTGYPAYNFPFHESFEVGCDSWFHDVNNDFNWDVISGSTPSSSTGPSSANDGSNYIYIESSSPNYPSKNSAIISPIITLDNACFPELEFKYHMYGVNMGSLNVYISSDEGATWSTSLWSRSGNQGNSWNTATIDLSTYIGECINIKFAVTTGSSYTSDVAIDMISVNSDTPNNTTIISSNTIWDDVRTVCNNIVIQNNSTLTITGMAFLSPNGSITVGSMSTLKVDGGSIIHGSINVNSGGDLVVEDNGQISFDSEDDINIASGGVLTLDTGTFILLDE